MMDLDSIRHATTFLQWDKDNCYIFQTKPSLHFTKWDLERWSLVHWRSQMYGKLFIRMRTRDRVIQRWKRLM